MIDKSGRAAVATLALSAAALVGLVVNEGYSDKAIIPVPGDVATVGFGSTTRDDGSPVRMGDQTTPPKALGKALRDVQAYEGKLKQCVTVAMTQGEYDSLVDLAYNVGPKAFCGSNLVKLLNAGDYAGACAEILRWRFYHGKDCSLPENKRLCGGLWVRRQAENKRCTGEAP